MEFWRELGGSEQKLTEAEEKKKTILLIEDDKLVRDMTELMLKMWGFNVVSANNWEEWIDKYNSGGIDLVFLDLWLPWISGADVCEALNRINERVKIIVYSWDRPELTWKLALADWFIKKPFDWVLVVFDTIKRIINNQK